MAAARAGGLVDTKVVAFSESHTALKFVIPVARRPQATGGIKAKSEAVLHGESGRRPL